ncbi:pseudouridine synthase [Chelativorans sp. Marseille-P2723]|uniref:pseudouridine synthase n=1 Tax=Chelativorans sp. Marseille-P2723 TaxID=2709133 RepID=UPI001FEE6A8A|nr:pseudouridine synthase [Chelativorans sp. Marseille-P2723]
MNCYLTARKGKGQNDDQGQQEQRDSAAQAQGDGASRQAIGAGEAGAGERIAKRLARVGVASRRDAEAMVAAGRVRVNGKVLASPAFNVRPSDRIEVDGEPLPAAERTRLFLFHKPAGFVTTTRDPEGRQTIFDLLPTGLPRLVTIGRLDINTEGLLLLTNDGGLKRVLELPSTGWLRRYRARVHGKMDPSALAELEHGIAVDGIFYGAITATLDRQQGSNAWLTLGLREGKNREVKNVLGALGLDVTRLIRVSYGPFQLGDLPEGAVQEIKGRMLRDQLGPRLIEEAGANFDAPIAQSFTSKSVRGGKIATKANEPSKAKADEQSKEGQRAGRKPVLHRRAREERREELRERLQTRPSVQLADEAEGRAKHRKGRPSHPTLGEGGAKRVSPARSLEREAQPERKWGKPPRPPLSERDAKGKPDAKQKQEKRTPLERRSRASNVWMAPGARPMGKKRAEEMAERQRNEESRGKRKEVSFGKRREAGGQKPRNNPKRR